ncbi:acyl-CoA ligase (AMP-forming), exosortase A system-associated [Nocardioides sp. MAH-18]|uniref:Acyl-CoA ligase (AMP-forming), exosortase A system-associated n=1 Tax=Nocardioides agri TaxID=2682843 RepID=A0A6L6XP92_9ACTN|nr:MULTISPECIES: acyl-CoA ligase (AMP-forming), exosortase A system-associated [unclassified Nocardioides]MBA2954228.1 acyl-CoA ligase (AMP-forming), exosortase A system-associated [Nocardioides sp. CGMCC 1.13656]MVQ49089.1 acyl-CoA ligase (AMP-forming), exosortase A system-associated [Nocardioides sp. MAH-18]
MKIHLHDLLSEQAHRRGEAPALTFRETTLGYGAVNDASRELAGGLLDLGVDRGDRIGIWLDKRIETVVSIFASSMAGAVFVPVNPVLKPDQVSYILDDCDVRVLVTTRQRWAQLRVQAEELTALRDVVLVDGADEDDELQGRVVPHSYAGLQASGRASQRGLPTHGVDLDMAAILYTSGSTGRPKGVVLSHRNLLVGAESVSSYLDNRPDDVILAALPLSFDAGLSQVTTAFASGAHVVLVNYLLARDVVRLCAKHQVTGLTCVPPLWIQLVGETWPEEATRSLRYFANTGGRMPASTLARLRETFPEARPFLMYGLTEAFRSTYLDPDEVDRRPDSIGRSIPNAEVLVLKPDGSQCAPGEEGELVHRGPLVALGYWNDPERTAQRFKPYPSPAPSWRAPEIAVWSGDTVVSDEDGFLYFVGRSDDMIKTSGYRVSPTEVEEAAYSTSLVRDAVALGVEDPVLGQRIVLVVTAAAGADLDPSALDRELRARLPLFMVPSDIRVVAEVPRSPNGKFDRVLLRKEVAS